MPTPQQSATLSAYTLASAQSSQALRERLQAFIEALWRSLGAYRNAQMSEFATHAVPMVEAAMAQTSSMMSGYLAAASQEAGFSATPLAVPTPTVKSVRGVSADEVYGRPFHLVWRQLHEGKPPADAIESGMKRAVQTALTDVQLAKTHTARGIASNTPITARPYWYKRVLEGGHSCGLCILASTQAYHVGDLLPIHPGCDCGVEPQWTAIPGHVIDEDLLTQVHEAVEELTGSSDSGGRAPDYRKVLITHEHGELGPVLALRSQSFTGPSDLTNVPH